MSDERATQIRYEILCDLMRDLMRERLAAMEAVAEAWASIDGKLEAFRYGKANPRSDRARREGYYEVYMHQAEELLKRIRDRGYVLMPIDDQGG